MGSEMCIRDRLGPAPFVAATPASLVALAPVPRPSRARVKEGPSFGKDSLSVYLELFEDLVFCWHAAPGGPCAAFLATFCMAATAASRSAAVFHFSSLSLLTCTGLA